MTKEKSISLNKNFLDRVKREAKVKKPKLSKKQLADDILKTTSRPRLIFSMDATASRDHAWEVAQQTTLSLFEAMPEQLDIALAYHRGGEVDEITAFTNQHKVFQDKLLTVNCRAGRTALNDLMSEIININRLKIFVYVGDCYEENSKYAYELAHQMKDKKIKSFIFHDGSSKIHGYDTDKAKEVFQTIVDITGGAVLDFNDHELNTIRDDLQAIAVYASGGLQALESKTAELPSAQKILNKLK